MKLSSFQNYLKQQNIQTTYFVSPDPTITYFTQMEPSHGYLIINQKSSSFYISKLDKKPQLKNIKTTIINKEFETKIKNNKITKVGINKTALTVQQLDKAKKLFPKAKFVDVSEQLAELRKTKTDSELSNIKKACSITSKAFDLLCNELPNKNLKTEMDVAFFLEKSIKFQGAQLAFPTIVAMGKNAATPHHITSNYKLKKGFLLLDFGARYNNYCADMTRIVFLGTPKPTEKKMYELLFEAQQTAVKQVSSETPFFALDKLVRNKLETHSKYFIHSLGHGIGLEVHEDPVFSNKESKIEVNVPFTIEPGVYLPGKYGLRIEDTVVWDGKKVEIMTKASKELKIIEY
jgi:Xaa-Pro aminopeptidase